MLFAEWDGDWDRDVPPSVIHCNGQTQVYNETYCNILTLTDM